MWGGADGTLAFEAEAVDAGGFETHRCGFCVLHPIRHLAGHAVTMEHVDGTVERTRMPDLIAPWQPFKDACALTHEALGGLSRPAEWMEGDAFAGRTRIALASSHEGRVLGVAALDGEGRLTAWIANVTARPQQVRVAPASGWLCATLDAAALAGAAGGRLPPGERSPDDPLDLPPCAVARLAPA